MGIVILPDRFSGGASDGGGCLPAAGNPGASGRNEHPSRKTDFLLAVALAVAVGAVFSKAGGFPFLHFDDPQYVTENSAVRAGLTRESVVWAFTAFHAGNWHPLTWLSHMLDVEIFGLNAGWHHGVNVILHAASAVLLFLALRSMTGSTWRSGFVAALFGLHPLHVESVVWVAERKDVLSALFWNIALLQYAGYARRRGGGRYAAVALAFLMGLLSKPSVVTFPFVLLLLDFWPLRREERFGALVVEKLPLFLLAAGAAWWAYVAQLAGGAVPPSGLYPPGIRISNALVSYVSYLAKTVWPASLSVVYPHPWVTGKTIPALQAAGAALFLAGTSVVAIRKARDIPCLAVGWFWYLGTLVPMIGLVQAGGQAMADRYTYLPLTGIFLAVAWVVPESIARQSSVRRGLLVIALSVLAVLSAVTWTQISYWNSGVTLFRRATEAVEDNWLGHFNLGVALEREGRPAEAAGHFLEAIRIYPKYYEANVNLGILLLRSGDARGAALYLRQALRLRPGDRLAAHYLSGIEPPGQKPRP